MSWIIAIVAGVPVFCIHFKWRTLSEGQSTDPVNSAFLLYACHVFKEGEL